MTHKLYLTFFDHWEIIDQSDFVEKVLFTVEPSLLAM